MESFLRNRLFLPAKTDYTHGEFLGLQLLSHFALLSPEQTEGGWEAFLESDAYSTC